MSRKIKKDKTYRGRLVAAFSVLMLLIVLEAVYYGYHMLDNRNNVVNAYKNDQLQMVAVLADSLEGMDETDMIDKIKSSVSVSGSEWAFLIKKDAVIYVKDDMTNAELSNITSTELSDYMSENDGIVSEAGIAGSDYTVGIFADRSYVLSSYGVNDFEFYIILAVVAVLLVLGGMVIEFAGRIGHIGRKVKRLEDELAARNEKFDEYERINDRYEEEIRKKESESVEKNAGSYYDMEVVDSLLSKSDDPELFPITFMFINVQMGERYFSRDEIFRIMDFIKSMMNTNHVTAEMSKGSFVVLMYKTDMITACAVREKLLAAWKNTEANTSGAEIDVRLAAVKNGNDPRNIFYQEVTGSILSGGMNG